MLGGCRTDSQLRHSWPAPCSLKARAGQPSQSLSSLSICVQGVDSKQLVHDVANALYASKICSYAQGMNIIKHKSADKNWDIDLGALARIWKVNIATRCICTGRSGNVHVSGTSLSTMVFNIQRLNNRSAQARLC